MEKLTKLLTAISNVISSTSNLLREYNMANRRASRRRSKKRD